MCLGNIGALLRGFGQYQQSLDYHSRAIRIHRETGDRRHESSALLSLGLVYGELGEHRAALESAEQAFAITREAGTADREVLPLVNIGVAQAGLGELEAVEATFATALRVALELGMPHGIALARVHLARVLFQQQRVDDALDLAQRARAAMAELDAPGIVADLESTMGRIHQARGEFDQAIAAHEVALRNARQVNDRGQVLVELNRLIDVKRAVGDREAELRLRDEASELAELLAHSTAGERGRDPLTAPR